MERSDSFQDLLRKFKRLSTTDHGELVSQFKELVRNEVTSDLVSNILSTADWFVDYFHTYFSKLWVIIKSHLHFFFTGISRKPSTIILTTSLPQKFLKWCYYKMKWLMEYSGMYCQIQSKTLVKKYPCTVRYSTKFSSI